MARILPTEDMLIRMQRDLKRSLSGDVSEVRWSMVIDLAKCAGCHACTIACVGRATFFGNRNDPESLICQLLGSPRRFRLKEELGTQPAVYYLH